MRTTESEVMGVVRSDTSALGIPLWRNNSGAAHTLSGVVRFGLGNESSRANKNIKSADLIGITRSGKFLSIECKTNVKKLGAGGLAQIAWMNIICANGGIAVITDGNNCLTPNGEITYNDFLNILKGA